MREAVPAVAACFIVMPQSHRWPPHLGTWGTVSMKETDGSRKLIGRSFELRHFSSDPRADGETDFKGETAIFTTEERVGFLDTYARVAGEFFHDAELNQPAVRAEDVRAAMALLRPQPLPGIRQRILLDTWRWHALRTEGTPPGPPEIPDGIRREADAIVWQAPAVWRAEFAPQAWRTFFWVSLVLPREGEAVSLRIGDAVGLALRAGFPLVANGLPGGPVLSGGETLELKIELDLVSEGGRFNVLGNGVMLAAWQPVKSAQDIRELCVSGGAGLRVLGGRGLGFDPHPPPGRKESSDQPFYFVPLFRWDILSPVDPRGWESREHDDRSWRCRSAPCVHGGILEAGEDLLLRQSFRVVHFARATLHVEALDPGGEIWINGRLVHRNEGPHAFDLDVGRWLDPDAENVLAIRVDHREEVPVRMRHTSTDRHTGWFLGRTWLDLHGEIFLDDLFVSTDSLGNPALLAWDIQVRNEHWGAEEVEPKADLHFAGHLALEVAPWYPEDGESVAVVSVPVRLNFREPCRISGKLEIPSPEIWTPDRPRLYRIRAVLSDEEGRPLDDAVAVTGLRTVSQEGGLFRLNGRPSLLLGGLLFGTRSPIEEQSKWLRCGTLEHLVRDILAVRALGGNTIRMSIHDGPSGGVNDPRLAEIGDQLGILFQWSTNEWVRTSSPWQINFEHLAADIRRVRNHPSIVIWQPANHPKFDGWNIDGARWFTRIVETILAVDSSRLISPTANFDRLHSPDESGRIGRDGLPAAEAPLWHHPLVVRGNMETPTGYGREWSVLRKWPAPGEWSGDQGWIRSGFREQYLASSTHACFDFESEESTSQPRWDLLRGQPFYRLRSYELGSEMGSIGRNLDCSEWRISQAWQAFSAYEAYRKKRLLDYDGMVWCSLDGGANCGTYEKPLTDAMGHKKLVFHTVRMAFSPTLAGSADVDVSYGPGDSIKPVILHLGESRTVTLAIVIVTPEGRELASKTYHDLVLSGGRSRTNLEPWPRPELPDGFYVVEYRLLAR